MKRFIYTILLTTAMTVPVAVHAETYNTERGQMTYVDHAPVTLNSDHVTTYRDTSAQHVSYRDSMSRDDWNHTDWKSHKVTQSVQQALKDSGFYKVPVTGIWDAQTEASLGGFQASKGLPVTGELDRATANRLGIVLPASNKEPTDDDIAEAKVKQPVIYDGTTYVTVDRDMSDDSRTVYDRQDRQAMNGDNSPKGIYHRAVRNANEDRMAYHREFKTLNRTKIQTLQQALADDGFYKGEVDGFWGKGTTSALRSYQASNGLRQTGKLNNETLDSLGLQVSETGKMTGVSPAAGN